MAFDTTAKIFPSPKPGGYAFVPTLEMGGVEVSTTGAVYTQQTGLAHFIAPGLIWLMIRVELSAKGTGTGACRIRWPSTATDGTPLYPSSIRVGIGAEVMGLSAVGIDQVSASAPAGGSVVELSKRVAASTAALDAADIGDTFVFRAHMTLPYTI